MYFIFIYSEYLFICRLLLWVSHFVLFAYTIVPIPTNKMTTMATDKECDIHQYVQRCQWDHIIGDTASLTDVSKDTKSKHPFLGALKVVSAIIRGTVTCLWYWV